MYSCTKPKVALIVLLLVAFKFSLFAQQANSYVFTQVSNQSLSAMTGSTQLVGVSQDDAASAATNIGFDFWFMGTRYTQFSASSNGGIRLGGTAISTTSYGTSFPIVSQQIITPYLGDSETSATGKVHFTSTGVAPNRVLTVEWLNMGINFGSTTSDGTFQARLYETSGKIEYVYGAMKVGGISAAGGGTTVKIGFCNTNTANNVFSVNQSTYSIDNTSPTALTNTNGAIVAAIANLNSAADGSRVQFSFLSPNPTTPSALTFSNISSTGYTLNWNDNATNEVGYVLYRSTDNITYTFNQQLAANSTNVDITGLTPNTIYYWKVFAVTEGNLGTSVNGSQTTFSAKNWNGAGVLLGTGGTDFNTAANWSPVGVPGATDDAIINVTLNATVTFSQATTTIGSLTMAIQNLLGVTFTLNVGANTLNIQGNTFLDVTGGVGSPVLTLNVGNGGKLNYNGNATFSASVGNTLGICGTGGTTGVVTCKGHLTYLNGGAISQAANLPTSVIMDGIGNQLLTFNNGVITVFPLLQIGNTNSPTVTLAGSSANAMRPNDLIVNSILVIPGLNYAINRNAAGGAFTMNAGSFLKLAGNTGGQTGSNFPLNYSTMSLNPTSTVEYNGVVGQTIFAGVTYGHLTFSNASIKNATAALTTAGNLTINTSSTFAGGTSLTHNIGGNWINNSIFSFTTANTINFNGNNVLQTVSGSASTPFYNVIVNKGTAITNVLDVTSLITLTGPANPLTITNGTFKLSSASTITPFTTGGGATIPTTGGLVNNGGTISSGNFSWTNNGLIRNILGSTSIGTNAGNSITNSSTSTFDVQGGTVTIAGRLEHNGGSFTQSGGTMTLCTVGNISTTIGNFDMSATTNMNITNGTIIFRNPNSAGTPFNSINIIAGAGTKTISGGTFQMGDASTPASQTFLVSSPVSLFNFTINSTNVPIVKLVTNHLTLGGTLTMNGGNLDGASNTKNVIITNSASTAVVRTSGMINTNLKRAIGNTSVTYLFPVGFTTNYHPASFTFTNLTSGDLNVLAVNGDESNLASSAINSAKSLNSFWTLTASNGLVSTNYAGSLNYSAALNDNVAEAPNYILGKFNTTWSYPTLSGTPTSTAISFTSASGFGNVAAGACQAAPTSNAGGDQNICGSSTTLSATAVVSPASGTWTVISGTGGSFTDDTNPTTNFSGTTGTTYILRWTVGYNGSGCSTNTDDVTIIFGNPPTAAAGTVNAVFVGDYFTVSGATAANGSILWTHNGVGYFDQTYFPVNNQTTTTPSYYVEEADFGQTVSLTMTVTGSGICAAVTSTANVTLNVNGNPALWHYQCGTTLPYIDEYVYAYAYPGATQYRFRLDGDNSKIYTTPASVFYFNLFSTPVFYNTSYSVDVAVFVAGSWSAYGPACSITTPTIPTTKVIASQCGTTLATIDTQVAADLVQVASQYRFRVFDGVTTQTVDHPGRVFLFTQLASFSYNTAYTIDVATFYNGAWTPYGATCIVTTPALAGTNIVTGQCGITVVNLDVDIYANEVFGATQYRFRATNGASQTLIKASRTFKLSQMSGILAGTTYSVDVDAFVNGAWIGYGSACNISTPAGTTTQLIAGQCGTSISDVFTDLYADAVSGASQYRFRVVNGLGTQTIIKASRTFKLAQLSNVEYGTVNIIDVDVMVNGSWIGYGATCNVTTPSTPSTKIMTGQCGMTVSSIYDYLYADEVPSATQYRFRIDGSQLVVKTNRLLQISQITGLAVNTTYSIDVDVFVSGAWVGYGSSCNITSPAVLAMKPNEVELNLNSIELQTTSIEDVTENQTTINAFPNPFETDFKLSFVSDHNEEICITVIDGTGRIIENFNATVKEITELKLGESYTSGMYTIQLIQGVSSKHIKVIKK